jgi:hypothetical protein
MMRQIAQSMDAKETLVLIKAAARLCQAIQAAEEIHRDHPFGRPSQSAE